MEQIAVSFTNEGQPATGLTPTIKVWRKDGQQVVDGEECREIGGGWYIYNFNKYSSDITYLYQFDGGSVLQDYDRYKFGGNDLDAYSNKYSWGRTAAPFFANVNKRFDRMDKSMDKHAKDKYDDTEIKKDIKSIKDTINARGGYDVYDKLSELSGMLNKVSETLGVVSSSVDNGKAPENFSTLNDKLDTMAEYVVKMKSDVDNSLNSLDENVAQRITESSNMMNDSFNNGMSDKVNIDQLLQQVERLESKLSEVVDSVVSKRLSDELVDKYNVNVSRKSGMSDQEAYDLLMGMGQQGEMPAEGSLAMEEMQPMESGFSPMEAERGMLPPEQGTGMQGRPDFERPFTA